MTLVDIVLTYDNGKQWHAKDIVLDSIHASTNEFGTPLLIYHGERKEISTEIEEVYEFSKSENSFVTNNLTIFSSTGIELDILADGLVHLEISSKENLTGIRYQTFLNVISKLIINLSDTDIFDIVDLIDVDFICISPRSPTSKWVDRVFISIVPLAD